MNTESGQSTSSDVPEKQDLTGGSPPTKNSRVFARVGCLLLTVIFLAAVGTVAYYIVLRPMLEFQNETVATAIINPDVETALGTPVITGKTTSVGKGEGQYEFTTPLTGPLGEGKLVFGGKLEGKEWTREYILFRFGGDEINLEPDELFNLDIIDDE